MFTSINKRLLLHNASYRFYFGLLTIFICTLAFLCGYSGVGSNLVIIKDNNERDCFLKSHPTGLCMYVDGYLLKQLLYSQSDEDLTRARYRMAFFLSHHYLMLYTISHDYNLSSPEISTLEDEIELILKNHMNHYSELYD